MPKGVLHKSIQQSLYKAAETMRGERQSRCEAAGQFDAGKDKRVDAGGRMYLTEDTEAFLRAGGRCGKSL